ncbi:MAG: HAD hydrolase-like protein [Acidimicrobiales bacterium]
MGIALDLDGVVWLGDEPIEGSADAVARLRAAGEQVLFCTNVSVLRVADIEAKLVRHGIPAAGDVVTGATAVGTLVDVGERVLVWAAGGVTEAVEARGARVVHEGPADAVVIGMHFDFDYAGLERAARAVSSGARLLATGDDPVYPTATGLSPGTGALLAAVETATGGKATLAGKPHGPMVALVRDRLGADGLMIGDRPDSDGRFALALGFRFGLVLSGVTSSARDAEPPPHVVAADLATMVDVLLSDRG